jgi:hypothetical protein
MKRVQVRILGPEPIFCNPINRKESIMRELPWLYEQLGRAYSEILMLREELAKVQKALQQYQEAQNAGGVPASEPQK